MRSRAAGWTLALLAGGVWGVAFFSWGLPLPIPGRVAATLILGRSRPVVNADMAGRLTALYRASSKARMSSTTGWGGCTRPGPTPSWSR